MSDKSNTCQHDPRTLAGKPIGQYPCPECGETVIAGLSHDPETPRTQIGINDWINTGEISVISDISEELESELTAAREESAGLRKEAQEKVTQMAHHLCQVEQQRDRLAEELREWKSNYNELSSHHNKHCTCMEIYQPRTNPRKNDMSEEMRREFEEFLKHNPELKCFNPEQAAWIAWSEAKKQISYELICRKCGLREERGEKPKCDF